MTSSSILTPDGLKTVAETVTTNGIQNTLIALIILIIIAFVAMFIGVFILILKTNTNTTNRLLATFEDNQKKDREMQLLKFNETTNQLKELTVEMKLLNSKYNNTIENINTLLEMHSEKTAQAIINDKPQSLRDFDKQSKQIIQSIAYESIDFVLAMISKNSLYENKNKIAKEILTRLQQNLQNGANCVDALPFRDERVKTNLFLKVDEYMMVAYNEIVKILNVEENYKREELERDVRDEREKFINKINAIRFVDLWLR